MGGGGDIWVRERVVHSRAIRDNPQRQVCLVRQPGVGVILLKTFFATKAQPEILTLHQRYRRLKAKTKAKKSAINVNSNYWYYYCRSTLYRDIDMVVRVSCTPDSNLSLRKSTDSYTARYKREVVFGTLAAS